MGRAGRAGLRSRRTYSVLPALLARRSGALCHQGYLSRRIHRSQLCRWHVPHGRYIGRAVTPTRRATSRRRLFFQSGRISFRHRRPRCARTRLAQIRVALRLQVAGRASGRARNGGRVSSTLASVPCGQDRDAVVGVCPRPSLPF